MKKMKKLFAVLLTLAMVLGMSMTSFAAAKNTITISGKGLDAEGAGANYGQIIKENRESSLGWQFATTEIGNAFVDAWNKANKPVSKLTTDQVIQELINLGVLENGTNNNPENKNVTAGTINSSSNFSAALAAVTSAATETLDLENGADVSKTGKGLYIITAHSAGYTYLPMAAYMNTAGDNVAVVAKGAKDQLNKTVAETGKSVAPGDEVVYTIDEEYLYIAPSATEKTFTITDNLTNGTFKANSVSVVLKNSINDTTETPLTAGTDYSINPYGGGTELVVDFSNSYYNSAYAGKIVVITYTAVAGQVTTTAPLKNGAHSSNGTGKIVEVRPVSFEVIKVDKDNESTPLPNANFQIYKEANQGDAGAVELTLENNTKVYGIPVGDVITTNSEGKASVSNLDAQVTYYVKETKAPNGYSLNNYAYELTGADTLPTTTGSTTIDNVTYTTETLNFDNFDPITVKDTKLSALPSTGGIGTTIFTIAGCAIMIAAAGLFFASRKKSDNK